MVVSLFPVGRNLYDPRYRRLVALLRDARVDAGLTQAELAVRMGRRQTFISKVELAQRDLNLIELLEICGALGVPLADLVHRWEADG